MKKIVVVVAILALAIFFLVFVKLKITGFVVTSINSCYDGDGGKVYDEAGFVQGEYYLFTREDFYEEDYCKGEVLVEHYCVKDSMHSYRESVQYRCSSGCADGRCLEEIEEIAEVPTKVGFLGKIKKALGF